ncbi:MAG: tRNA adenosine(34) deaminase TadA [Deltaproteobacteria bacterium]|nr:tRNA adenosine(34) deaminase TadA [Deltaproteobacteria bacterium]
MWHAYQMRPFVLTIHDSDPQGRRGLQADLAVFFAHDLHGKAVVTGINANSAAIRKKEFVVTKEELCGQIRIAFSTNAPTCIKVGATVAELPFVFLEDLMAQISSSWVVECPQEVRYWAKIDDPKKNEARRNILSLARKSSLFILDRCEASALFSVEIVDKGAAVKAALLFLEQKGHAIFIRANASGLDAEKTKTSDVLGFFSDGKARIKVFSQDALFQNYFFEPTTVFSAAVASFLVDKTQIVDAVEHAIHFVRKMGSWPTAERSSLQARGFENSPGTEQDLVDEKWMRTCITEAEKAGVQGDVPVGAIVVKDGKIVGRGANRREQDQDPTAHAELIALREAADFLRGWRLIDCTLYVTLEPCAMCAGALVNARLHRVVFGAADAKAGAVGSLQNICQDKRLNHIVDVKSGVCETECKEQLQNFFKKIREQNEHQEKS